MLSFSIHERCTSDLQFPCLGEGPEAAVVGSLDIVGETAARQLLHIQMVTQTLTARSFSGAAGIRAVAILHVLFFLAFHKIKSFFQVFLVANSLSYTPSPRNQYIASDGFS